MGSKGPGAYFCILSIIENDIAVKLERDVVLKGIDGITPHPHR